MNEAITSRVRREFPMCFTATRRGARLARRLVSLRLDEWGHPYGSDLNQDLTLIAAELAANAVRHGLVAGRDFRLRLVETGDGVFRVEVSDTRTERRPVPEHAERPAAGDEESGRGLYLVARLADRWAWTGGPGRPGRPSGRRSGSERARAPPGRGSRVRAAR